MKSGRFWIGFLGVFGFLFIFNWLVHGILLNGLYAQSPTVWRPKSDMRYLFQWLVFSQVAFAFVFCLIFTKGYENRGTGEGVRYGFLIGALFAPTHLGWYALIPIPISLVFAWVVATLVEYTLAGGIMAAMYKTPEPPPAASSSSADETQPLP